jgi:hypothetical protein
MRTFVPGGEDSPLASIQFRMVDLASRKLVFTGTNPTMIIGLSFEPSSPITALASSKTYSWRARVFGGTAYSAWFTNGGSSGAMPYGFGSPTKPFPLASTTSSS